MKLKYVKQDVSDSSEVIHLKLWDGSVFDYSLNGLSASASGTNIAPSYPGYSFNGLDDFINLGSAFQSTFRASWSISVWVKLDDGQGANQIICGTSNLAADDRLRIRAIDDGTVVFFFESDGVLVSLTSSGTVFANGETPWTHIVMTAVADTSINGYANGESQGTGDATALTFADWTSADNIYLGAVNSNSVASQFVSGNVSDFRMYNKTLGVDEIKNIYNQTRWRYGV